MDLGVPYVQTNSYGNASEYVKTIQILWVDWYSIVDPYRQDPHLNFHDISVEPTICLIRKL